MYTMVVGVKIGVGVLYFDIDNNIIDNNFIYITLTFHVKRSEPKRYHIKSSLVGTLQSRVGIFSIDGFHHLPCPLTKISRYRSNRSIPIRIFIGRFLILFMGFLGVVQSSTMYEVNLERSGVTVGEPKDTPAQPTS